jgi:hypothetical protein
MTHAEKLTGLRAKNVPNARGPSPAGIFAVTASVSALIAQTSFENQLDAQRSFAFTRHQQRLTRAGVTTRKCYFWMAQ